jgi:hypothetical protein
VIGPTPGTVVKRWPAALARCHSISCRSNASTRTVTAPIWMSYPFDLFVQLYRGEPQSSNASTRKFFTECETDHSLPMDWQISFSRTNGLWLHRIGTKSMANVFDTTEDCSLAIQCLKQRSYDTVGRYYARPGNEWKTIKLPEAVALARAGMSIVAIYQDRQNQAADFDLSKGRFAGTTAYNYAAGVIFQTAGSAIYFSVDYDASESEVRATSSLSLKVSKNRSIRLRHTARPFASASTVRV